MPVSLTKFPDFISKFMAIKEEKQINQNWGVIDGGRSYLWRIGEAARLNFLPHMELEIPESTAEERTNFQRMFDVGSDMMGIAVASPLTGEYSSKIILMQMSHASINVPISGVLTTLNTNLFNDSAAGINVHDPITNEIIYVPNRIQMGSVKITGDFECVDSIIISKTRGAIMGKQFTYGVTPTNEVNGKSLFGTIDYSNGKLYLNRAGTEFENEILAMNMSTDPEGVSTFVGPESLSRGSYNVACNVYKDPLTVIWEWSL